MLLAFLPALGFGAILALFGGLSGTPQGGGSIWGGPPTTTAVMNRNGVEQAVLVQMIGQTNNNYQLECVGRFSGSLRIRRLGRSIISVAKRQRN